LLVDLYLIVSDYTAVHRSWAMRWLNHLVPPNVYYIETSRDGDRVRAKYALVSLPQLEQLTGPTTLNPYFWARFAQPTGLLWSRDPAVARCVADALGAAEIVRGDLERYRRVSAALGPREPDGSAARAARRWFLRRLQGRGLSLLRLAKASWTFAGGADYLAWKISRHAGVPVVFSAWERRHPFLAAPFVLWRLARRRVVR